MLGSLLDPRSSRGLKQPLRIQRQDCRAQATYPIPARGRAGPPEEDAECETCDAVGETCAVSGTELAFGLVSILILPRILRRGCRGDSGFSLSIVFRLWMRNFGVDCIGLVEIFDPGWGRGA